MENKQTNAVQTAVSPFLTLLGSEVERGIYVWGGDGEAVDQMKDPEAWIERKETSAGNAARAVRLYRKRKANGIRPIRAFDCSGYVYWALKELGLLETDVSSRGLYALCSFRSEKKQGNMTKDDLRPGDLVFRHDGTRIVHVGVYGENGKVLEARGRDYGVTESDFDPKRWNRFGRLDVLAEASSPTTPVVFVLGGSVYVRRGGSTEFCALGIVHRGERYPLLGTAESGWYRIAYEGAEAYLTNNPKYTEVRYE